jgi:two-component system chemotaxis response regulator CheB
MRRCSRSRADDLEAHGMSEARILRVLVVDDSVLVRQTILQVLSAEGFEVITAADPFIAMERMKAAAPDVILLDLNMPRMDGLSFLRKIMSEDPRPVVICSAVAPRGSGNALRALEEGAVDIVEKPQIGVQRFLHESSLLLADAVRAAAVAKLRRRSALARRPPQPRRIARPPGIELSSSVIAVGASTGGTNALRVLLEGLPADFPAIAIVQHMPQAFTAAFAKSLDRTSQMHVHEAEDGEHLTMGIALIAPGDRHMRIVRGRGGWMVALSDGALISRHRPSVDELFRSVAATAGADSVGVLLTGMGADGADGLLEMHRSGAFTIAQDEATSVVFGMPREAIARGAVDRVLSIQDIAPAIQSAWAARRFHPTPQA